MNSAQKFLGIAIAVASLGLAANLQALDEGCAERCGQGDRKSLFCHVPQGNPENVQEICISDNAVPFHLQEHTGDHCGSCQIECEEITCCPEQTAAEVAELLLQDGELLLEDSDGDVGSLCCEPDSDDDGACGEGDLCPDDPDKTEPGACGCGVPDTDSNDNGIPDCDEGGLAGDPQGPSFGGGFCSLIREGSK